MENIVEKVVDRSIFKNPVKFRVPDTTKCKTCDGSGSIDIKNGPKVICPTCYGSGTSFQGGKREVEGVVQYVPIAFEEKEERVIQLSVTYYENDKPINLSIPQEDLLGFVKDDKLQEDETEKNE